MHVNNMKTLHSQSSSSPHMKYINQPVLRTNYCKINDTPDPSLWEEKVARWRNLGLLLPRGNQRLLQFRGCWVPKADLSDRWNNSGSICVIIQLHCWFQGWTSWSSNKCNDLSMATELSGGRRPATSSQLAAGHWGALATCLHHTPPSINHSMYTQTDRCNEVF